MKRNSWLKLLVFGAIGGIIVSRGLDALYKRKMIGVVWVFAGAIVAYIGGWNERINYHRKKRDDKEAKRIRGNE